ncbi:hypothetical protein NDU88_006677 [Pleurodeles waltl]|uniref:Uncharacterized protein n=1 Tax=Pleurodeles waltl TaxID=8319 RepID=A0AAV7WEY2_PLEWA|nr:hypothetical protein NDU88_006677 [Pleurodeles waltl]
MVVSHAITGYLTVTETRDLLLRGKASVPTLATAPGGCFAIGLIRHAGGPGEAEWLQTIAPGDRGERLTLAWRPDRRSYRTAASFVLVVRWAPAARTCGAAWAGGAVLGWALGERTGRRRPRGQVPIWTSAGLGRRLESRLGASLGHRGQ